jgi:hypothetical protein
VHSNRRNFLGLSAAALALQIAWLRGALAAGSVEKGIYRLRGEVRVNGSAAVEGMEIKAGDVITTGATGEAVFVSGRDAFMIRANARVEAQGASAGDLVLGGLRVVTGVESQAARSYVCVCYGVADIVSAMEPSARETVSTTHHEQPRYVMGRGAPMMLMGAPVINHSDAELIMLESLLGRRPPFTRQAGYRQDRY